MIDQPAIRAKLNAASAITLAGAASSLAAVGFVARGNESVALSLMMLAVLCDRLDGLVARRFDQSSDFGKQLDSLADAASFLVAPAAIVLILSEGSLLVLVTAIQFVVSGIWRLATFNLTGDTAVFRGLPTTHAAGFFILLWAAARLLFPDQMVIALAAYLCLSAPVMLSSVTIQKNGWLTKALQILLIPTLIAAWWPT